MELCGAFKCGTSTLFYVVYFLRSVMYVNGLEQYPTDHEKPLPDKASKPEEYLFFYQGVEGTPGIDFPVYSHIPRTTFSCKGLESGYYADIDTDCQVFHICEEEKKISFLCPNGTIFQQSDLICEWWFKVNCSNSPYLYEESAENLRENVAKRKSFRRVHLDSQESEKNTKVAKENSFIDSAADNKFNNNNNKNDRLVSTQPNFNNHNSNNIGNSRSVQQNQQNRKQQVKTINNNNKNNKHHPKQAQAKVSHRNDINSDFQKIQAATHQKTRRFNENDLGNYQNPDYDKTNYSQTTTFAPTTQRYSQNTFKGYHVQFPPSTTGIDTSENQNTNIQTGPKYKNDERSTYNQEFEFHSHVTSAPNKKPQKFKINDRKSETIKSTERPKSEETQKHNSNQFSTPNTKSYTNKHIEAPGSEETQITQESASFLKNSFNSIHETSSYNPFPNHRTTYSELKTLPYLSTKVYSTISSVTPQYITTQPINNGKPFLGSRVGTNIKTTNDPLFINPQVIKSKPKSKIQLVADDIFKLHVISNAKNVTNSSLVSPKVLEKILFAKIKPIDESTTAKGIFESTTEQISTLEDFSSTTESISTIITPKPVSKVTPRPQKKHSKTTTVTSKPFLIQYEDIPENLSTQSRSKTPDYAVIYGSYSSTPIPSNTVQVKFNKTTNKIGIQLGKSFGSSVSRNKPASHAKPIKIQQSTSKPNTDSQDKSKEEILVRHSSKSIPESLRDSQRLKSTNQGFYVTKSQLPLYSTTLNPTETTLNELHVYNITIRSTTQHPRPFQRFLYETTTVPPFDDNVSKQPVVLDYKISTASPFKHSSTPEPTLPTPFRTSTPSIYENIDNMIDVLTEITKGEASSGKSRPGLVVPPSVGPQTLHTLAVYFANALDGVISNKVKNSGKYPEKFMKENKEKLTTLLTQMTVHGYNQLFNQIQERNNTVNDVAVNITKTNQTYVEDLKLESPQIRQLARNFTIALSSYLNDPEMFRKDLENFRPTEPAFDLVEIETTTDYNIIDEELLNYSDADTKTSLPPIFSTPHPPSPTWGFILAAKSPNKFDIENSVSNSDLNTADTQSFVPGLNDINGNSGKSKVETTKELPQDHWTTSTSATNFWQSTFSIDPVLFNEEFDSTSPLLYDVETSTEEVITTPVSLPAIGHTREVNYELHSLPKFSFNSSEVSGILIDFMNNSSDDSNDKLHRILRKLNTTEGEFLVKMKEIESNPITRRLILLLISECGKNATQDIKHHNEQNFDSIESLELSETNPLSHNRPQKETSAKEKNEFQIYVDPNLKEDDQDTRALQLLNTLYSIASKLGK